MMSEITVGTQIPTLELPPITRTTLALYAGASGDHNGVHIDSDVAKNAGMPDVFAQGMLSMAYLGRMLTNWKPQSKLRRFTNKFSAITHLQDIIICSGEVVEISNDGTENLARCEIFAIKQTGEKTLVGEAVVAV